MKAKKKQRERAKKRNKQERNEKEEKGERKREREIDRMKETKWVSKCICGKERERERPPVWETGGEVGG